MHKNITNLSAFVFLLLLLSSCNAFTKIVTSSLTSYGLIIHAELFQATENALTTAAYCDHHSTVWYYSTFHFQTNSQTLQSLSLKLLCLFLMGWWCCQHWKVSHIMLYETCLLYKHQWNTRWAFARKLDIFTCENNMLSLHVKISPLVWFHNKPHLLTKKLF